MTLTNFLLARIEEDAALARAASEQDGTEWETSDGGDVYRSDNGVNVATGQWGGLHETGEHIARWDPAHVLAECEAKQWIVDHQRKWKDTLDFTPEGWTESTTTAYRMAMDWVVERLASAYADHPGYREAVRDA